jgi:serine/threonine protein kinase
LRGPEADPDIEIIARGNSGLYGAVWRGRQRSMRRDVGIKLFHPEMAGARDVEAHANSLARVGQHENIVTVYLVARVNHPESGELVKGVVMQWLDGESLAKRHHGRPFEIAEATAVLDGLLRGVRHLHNNDVTHDDLHDGNVMLCNGTAKIIDSNYSENPSLSRLGTLGKEDRKQCDIDGAKAICRRVFGNTHMPHAKLEACLGELLQARTLDDLRAVVRACAASESESPSTTSEATPIGVEVPRDASGSNDQGGVAQFIPARRLTQQRGLLDHSRLTTAQLVDLAKSGQVTLTSVDKSRMTTDQLEMLAANGIVTLSEVDVSRLSPDQQIRLHGLGLI